MRQVLPFLNLAITQPKTKNTDVICHLSMTDLDGIVLLKTLILN